MKLAILLFVIIGLSACSPEAEEPLIDMNKTQIDLNNEIVEEQYQKLLEKTWINLNQLEKKVLEIIVNHESGANMQDIENRQDEAESLKNKKLIYWNAASERYTSTKLGKEVYEKGQELIQKDPYKAVVEIK